MDVYFRLGSGKWREKIRKMEKSGCVMPENTINKIKRMKYA